MVGQVNAREFWARKRTSKDRGKGKEKPGKMFEEQKKMTETEGGKLWE